MTPASGSILAEYRLETAAAKRPPPFQAGRPRRRTNASANRHGPSPEEERDQAAMGRLLARVRAGEPEAKDELWQKHRAWIVPPC